HVGDDLRVIERVGASWIDEIHGVESICAADYVPPVDAHHLLPHLSSASRGHRIELRLYIRHQDRAWVVEERGYHGRDPLAAAGRDERDQLSVTCVSKSLAVFQSLAQLEAVAVPHQPRAFAPPSGPERARCTPN